MHKNLKVPEMTPDQHDRLAAKSQNITHFIGRSLEAMGSHVTEIDTIGYRNLLAAMEQHRRRSYSSDGCHSCSKSGWH